MKGFACGKVKTTGALKGSQFIRDPYLFRGVADLLVFTPKLMFIEVKAGKNKQSPDQLHFEQMCQNADIPYVLAYSLDDIITLFP